VVRWLVRLMGWVGKGEVWRYLPGGLSSFSFFFHFFINFHAA
jgi:hypothetical protein